MTATHGLTEKTLTQLASVLARFSNVEKAILFGSRAKGTHKPGSDIDLALVGEKLDWRTIGRIDSALDDLPLPYCFSLIVFSERTDPEVAAHIRRVGIPLFERNASAATVS
jgi:predicted nucleotidyltransferase